MADVLLHETAVSWLRRREEATRPRAPWTETPGALAERLQRAVTHVNNSFNVRGLCLELPARFRALVESHGDRLPK